MFSLGLKTACMVLAFTWKYRSKDGCKLPSKFLIQACDLSELRHNSVFLLPSNPAVLATDIQREPSSQDAEKIINIVRKKVYQRTGITIPIEPTLVGFLQEELDVIFNVK